MNYRIDLQAIWHIMCRNLIKRVLHHCLDEVIKLKKVNGSPEKEQEATSDMLYQTLCAA
jgi:hypothetical protein